MTTLRKETKKGKSFIYAYNASRCETINEAYSKPSSAKRSAFRRCVEMCQEENGHGLRITGAGTFVFTVGWKTSEGLRIETANYSYIIK